MRNIFTVGKEDVGGGGATCTSLNSPKSSSSSSSLFTFSVCSSLDDGTAFDSKSAQSFSQFSSMTVDVISVEV